MHIFGGDKEGTEESPSGMLWVFWWSTFKWVIFDLQQAQKIAARMFNTVQGQKNGWALQNQSKMKAGRSFDISL